MATVQELEAKRLALDEKIAAAKKAAKQKKLREEATAKAHLKNVLGGWCLAFLADPTNDQSFKQLMLSMTDESVTKQPEHLARIKFEEMKKAAGV